MASVAVVSVKGTKRRTQKRRRSQQKRRLQHGNRHRSRSRKPMAKKRKTSAQGKHPPMKKRRGASKRSFRSDARKPKGAKGSGRFLSREAKGLMITFVEDTYKHVSREAVVSPMHVQAALQTVVPKRRWKQVAFGNRH